jgi:hypothetical protein
METTTDEREKMMARLKRIANEMTRLEGAAPTAREMEIWQQYPRMPRERALRTVAAEIVDARR